MDYRTIWHQDNLAPDNLTPDNLVPGEFGTGKIGTRTMQHWTNWHQTILHRIDKRAILHREIIPNIACSIALSLGPGAYLIFVVDAANIVRGEFFVMWRNFRCRNISDIQMWKFFRCREILDVKFFWMCGNLFDFMSCQL